MYRAWAGENTGKWTSYPQPMITRFRRISSLAEQYLKGSAYVHHIAADEQPEKERASFGENHGCLREVKAMFDPDNLFRVNREHPTRAEKRLLMSCAMVTFACSLKTTRFHVLRIVNAAIG